MALIKIVRPLYSKMRLDYIAPQDHQIFALDSTTISCSLKLMSWAQSKYSKGAVKMDLKALVTEPQPLIQNQAVKEPTLF